MWDLSPGPKGIYWTRPEAFRTGPPSYPVQGMRLTNDRRKTKRFSPFARKMLLSLVAKIKFYTSFHITTWLFMAILSWLGLIHVWFDFIWMVSCSWSNHMKLLLMFVAEKKPLLLLEISPTVKLDKNFQIKILMILPCKQSRDHISYKIISCEIHWRVLEIVTAF